MKRCFGPLLLVPFFLAGCAASGEDPIIADIKAMNNDTADAIARADDMEAMQQAMQRHEERDRAIAKKLQNLSSQQRKAVQAEMGNVLKDSEARFEKALESFSERLKKGPHPIVLMETSKGPIKIELYEKLAPITVKNFLQYVDDKFYDGTIFHRVIEDFMVQTGGFQPGMTEKKTRAHIINESYNGLLNKKGTLAMARTDAPHSASSQFFINTKDNGFLDKVRAQDSVGYAVFGNVVEGMDVVDQIRKVPTTTRGGHGDVPVDDVLVKSIRRVEK